MDSALPGSAPMEFGNIEVGLKMSSYTISDLDPSTTYTVHLALKKGQFTIGKFSSIERKLRIFPSRGGGGQTPLSVTLGFVRTNFFHVFFSHILLNHFAHFRLIHCFTVCIILIYRPFHQTLPRSSAFVNWISD